jgi:hypothetical protein
MLLNNNFNEGRELYLIMELQCQTNWWWQQIRASQTLIHARIRIMLRTAAEVITEHLIRRYLSFIHFITL